MTKMVVTHSVSGLLVNDHLLQLCVVLLLRPRATAVSRHVFTHQYEY